MRKSRYCRYSGNKTQCAQCNSTYVISEILSEKYSLETEGKRDDDKRIVDDLKRFRSLNEDHMATLPDCLPVLP